MNPRVFVEVSDKYLWALRPFAYLFNIYWSELQPVLVFGYSRPDFTLPRNFSFYSIANQNFPAEYWSNGFIQFLSSQYDSHFILLLADYWLCRTVDLRGVVACADYMNPRDNVLRFDLTADRLYAGGMYDVDYWGCYDIIETNYQTPYQLSLQAAIWNRHRLLELIVANKSPWETEIGTQVPSHMRVLGTRQYPVRYANGLLKGNIDFDQLELIPSEHRNIVISMIPDHVIKKTLENAQAKPENT